MKKITFLLFSLFAITFGFAQCDYTLNISDSFDGAWNGGFLEVNLDGAAAPGSPFTVTAGGGMPQTETFTITVNDGQAIELVYNYSVTDNTNYFDVGYELIDSEGIQVSELVGGAPAPMGVPAAPATLFTGTTACPTCPAVTNVVVSNETADGGLISWTDSGQSVSWEILYGPAGFDTATAGTLVPASTNPFTLTGAPSASNLDVYVRPICAGNDVGSYRGPVTLMTLATCPQVGDPNLAAVPNAVTSDSVTFFWLDNGNTTVNYEAQYGAPGFDPTVNAGTTVPFTIVPGFTQYELMGLTSETTYELYIRADCGMGDFSFWSATPLQFTTTISCPAPTALTLDNATITDVTVNWLAGAQETEWEVEVGPAGFTPGTGTEVGTATVGATMATVGGLTDSTAYDVYVRANCDPGTANDSSSWTGPLSFTSPCLSFTAPYAEDFDLFTATTSFTNEACWSSPDTTGYTWDVTTGGTPSSNTGPTVAQSGTTYFFTEASAGGNGDVATLLGPTVDLSGLAAPALSFYYHMFGADMGTLALDIAVAGQSFTQDVLTLTGQQQAAQGDAWVQTFVDLTPYAGQEITIRFRGVRGGSFTSDMAIDTIEINEAPSCLPPTNLSVDMVTAQDAVLNLTDVTTAIGYEYVLQAPGTGVPAAAGTAFAGSGEPLTGLTAITTYEVYVRADCGMGDFSDWAGPVTFTTPCDVFTVPYVEPFANATFDVPAPCWEESLPSPVTAGPVGGNGAWGPGNFANDAANGQGMRINLWVASKNDWLVTPAFDLSGGPWEVSMDVALTPFSGTGTTQFGSDDFVQVVASDDAGATWSVLETYDVNNPVGNTSQTVYIDVAAYTGDTIFGIIGSEGTIDDPEDNYFHVDNFRVDVPTTCLPPTNIVASAITDTSVQFDWVEGGNVPAVTDYEVFVLPTGSAAPSGPGTPITGATTYTEMNLTPVTTYDFYVRALCSATETSIYQGPLTFTTACAVFTPAYLADFTNATFDVPATCWEESGPSPITAGPNGANGSWGPGNFANNAANGQGMRINLWLASKNDWIVSPTFDLSGGPWELSMDVALTPFSGTGPTTFGSDDFVSVVVSTDSGVTWTAIATYDVNNPVGNTGETVFIDLSAYNGDTRFGIIGSEGTVDDPEDNYFHVDNFRIAAPTTCLPPTGVTASSITSTSFDITYADGANMPAATMFEYVVSPAGTGIPTAAGTPVTGLTFTESMLTPATAYEVWVRADCGGGSVSNWVGPLIVETACAPVAPTYLEDFAGATFDIPGVCWEESGPSPITAGPNGANGSWGPGNFANDAANGQGMRINLWLASKNDWIVSPTFDLSGGPWELSMDVALTPFSGTGSTQFGSDDFVSIVVSTDSGNTWTAIETYDVNNPVGNTAQTVFFDLSAFTGDTIFGIIGSEGTVDDTEDNYFHVDNFQIAAPTMCLPPVNIAASNITSSSFDVIYVEGGNTPTATTFEYVVSPAGTGIPTAAGTPVTGLTFTESMLTPATAYEVWVRTDCGANGFSDWVGPLNVETACAAIVPNYTEDFSNATFDNPGVCWEEADNTDIVAGPNDTNSAWTNTNYLNDATNANGLSARYNLYLTGNEDWIVTPDFDLGTTTNYQVSMDLAIVDYLSQTPGTLDADDTIRLVISDDNGVTWTVLQTWDINYVSPQGGENVVVDLTAYSNIVRMAVIVSDGPTSGPEDLDIYVDNFSVEPAVGFEDETFTGFSFYPNPATDTINVSANSNMTSVSFTNMLGQQVQSTIVNDVNGSIDISGFAQGVYLMNVTMDGAQRSFRVIKE